MAPLTLIAAYDVREDDRRARLAATLQTLGDRVQKSVFVIAVDAEELPELRRRALSIIDADTDSLLLFRQCATCWEAHIPIGQASVPTAVTHWVVL